MILITLQQQMCCWYQVSSPLIADSHPPSSPGWRKILLPNLWTTRIVFAENSRLSDDLFDRNIFRLYSRLMEWKWFWCHINLFVFGTNQNVCGMDYWWEKCKKMKLLLAFDAHLICVQLKLFPALEVPHLSLLISLQNKWWWKIDILFCISTSVGQQQKLGPRASRLDPASNWEIILQSAPAQPQQPSSHTWSRLNPHPQFL